MEKPMFHRFTSLWSYHSGVPTALTEGIDPQITVPETLSEAVAPLQAAVFTIKFKTQTCAPNHIVTLRTETNGWWRDIHGAYIDGAWRFRLDKALYPNGVTFKFVLDHCHWAKGMNVSLPSPNNADFDDSVVEFEEIEPRYRHYYDNLQVSENNVQQLIMHANHDEAVTYDLIVVGSGISGGILALRAAQLGRKVLVLDAGRLEYSTHTFNLPHARWGELAGQHGVGNYTKFGNTHIGGFPTMNLGGRSVFWYGIIPRMRNWELQFWPSHVTADLTSAGYYDAAEALLRKHQTTGTFQEGLIQDLQALFPNHEVCDTPRSEHQPNIGQSSFIEQSTGTFSTAELLYDALTTDGTLGRANLVVNLNHLVTLLETTGSKITGVVCQDLVGNCQRVYHAKAVVLAAGSIESPKIALLSNLTDANGKTGKGLTDHGSFFTRPEGFEIPANSPLAGNDKYARIFLYADGSAADRFNMEVELNGDYFRVRHANVAYWEDYVKNKTRTTVHLKATCATPLIDSNFVKLANVPNEKVTLCMAPSPFGSETRPAVVAMGNKILNYFGVQSFNLSDNSQFYFGNGGTPSHAGGTMRMSDNGTGVVNTDLRHEAYDNLYVCDASVSPFIPAANPSLTIAALALRLAAHLHGVLP